MKKFGFLLATILFIFLFLIMDVGASAKEETSIVFSTNVSYHEVIFDNSGEQVFIEISEEEYFEKEKLKNIVKDLQEIQEDLNNISLMGMTGCGSRICIDPGDGGGGGYIDPSLIVHGTTSNTKVYCNLSNYTYCEGLAQTVGSITKLETIVSVNPKAKTRLKVVNKLTWNEPPMYSLTDFSSISYNGVYLDPDRETIKGEVYVSYDEIKRDILGRIKTRSSRIYEEEISYVNNKKFIVIEEHGIIWEIDKVYKSYMFTPDYLPEAPLFHNGEMVFEADVKKDVYTLTAELDLLGDYSSYNQLNKLTIGGDYRHCYPGITITSNLTLRAGIPKPAGFLSISLTPTTKVDGSRFNEVELYFR